MPKTAYLVFKAGTRVSELSQLLEMLFAHRTKYKNMVKRSHIAERILRKIKAEGALKAEEWRNYVKELDIPVSEYYKVLKRLRAAGLIRKGKGHNKGRWVLSREFSIMLRDFADYWERWAFGEVRE